MLTMILSDRLENGAKKADILPNVTVVWIRDVTVVEFDWKNCNSVFLRPFSNRNRRIPKMPLRNVKKCWPTMPFFELDDYVQSNSK